METPIKPGKYKMRNGCKAIIAAVAPSDLDVTQPVVGWWTVSSIQERWTLGMWCLEGKFNIGPTQSAADLISPWIDAPIFNHWDKVPWAKAVYRFGINWYATSHTGPLHLEPVNRPYEVLCTIQLEDRPIWDGPDKDSLILRPENV